MELLIEVRVFGLVVVVLVGELVDRIIIMLGEASLLSPLACQHFYVGIGTNARSVWRAKLLRSLN